MARRAAAPNFTDLTIGPAVFAILLECEALDSVLIQEVDKGFRILIGFGGMEKPLGLVREDRDRVFRTLKSASDHLTKLGVAHSGVDRGRHPAPPKPPPETKGPRRKQAQNSANTSTIKPGVLAQLPTVDSVVVQAIEGGFRVLIRFEDMEKPLGLVREDRERVFKTLQSASNYLMKFGIAHFIIDRVHHVPPSKLTYRLRQDDALERTQQAIAYDAWFHESVEDAIAEIDAGTAVFYKWSPEEHEEAWERAIAEGRAERAAKAEGAKVAVKRPKKNNR